MDFYEFSLVKGNNTIFDLLLLNKNEIILYNNKYCECTKF